MELASLKTILIDGDGVLWRADEAIPGLNFFFDVLAQRGIQWGLLTNNNTRTVDDYVYKLGGFGIQADPSRIFSSSTVTADYLKTRYGLGAAVHAVGMKGVIETLEQAGFQVSYGEKEPANRVVAVVAGLDRALTYEKIKVAMRLILAGAEFVATNTDGTFPTPDGLNPGTGLIIGALQATTNIQPTVIGKPEPAIFYGAIKGLNADPATTAMLGDRLDTDILGARRAGIGSIAVLTGVTSRAQLANSEIQPDLVFESIAGLADALLAVSIILNGQKNPG